MSTQQDIIDMLTLSFAPEKQPTGTSSMAELGLDSFDAIEVQLMFEDRWGEKVLGDYVPDTTMPLMDVAAEIDRRLK